MDVGLKELRVQPGRILSLAKDGVEIVITKNGKPAARLVPIGDEENAVGDKTIFGMWSDNEAMQDVEGSVRDLRKGRRF